MVKCLRKKWKWKINVNEVDLRSKFRSTSGKILFNNEEYSKEIYDDIKNKIAIVFQNPDNQFVGSTVEEDIAFGLEIGMYHKKIWIK